MVDFSAQYRLIGARIAYFRKLKRYTQEELAFRASISTSYLSRIERGIYIDILPMPKGRGFLDTNDTCLLK